MLGITGFVKGNLPFRYMGVPICSKRISAAAEHLIDNICARTKIWSSGNLGNLSFAARLVLVNSVLMSIQVY